MGQPLDKRSKSRPSLPRQTFLNSRIREHTRGGDHTNDRTRDRNCRGSNAERARDPPPNLEPRSWEGDHWRRHERDGSSSEAPPRSTSPERKMGITMTPHDSDVGGELTGECFRAEVIERQSTHPNQESTVWQAQIDMPHGRQNGTGQRRFFSIRGPPRRSQEQAKRDAEELSARSGDG